MSGSACNARIRAVASSDLEALEAIERECFSTPWTLAQLEAFHSDEKCIFLLAENEKADILGYVGCQTVLDEGHIFNVAVLPAFRRCGAASALVSALIAAGKERGLSFLTLEVRESNVPAIALYNKHGFVRVGVIRDYYQKPKEAAMLMTRFL